MLKLEELVARMRSLGVVELDVGGCGVSISPPPTPTWVTRIRISDTIPAPPPSFEATELDEPQKPPGTCIALGCSEPGGWHFDTRYCGPHGRAAAGVKP